MAHPFIHQPRKLFTHPFIQPFMLGTIYLPIYLTTRLFIDLFIYLSIHLPLLHPFVHLPIHSSNPFFLLPILLSTLPSLPIHPFYLLIHAHTHKYMQLFISSSNCLFIHFSISLLPHAPIHPFHLSIHSSIIPPQTSFH